MKCKPPPKTALKIYIMSERRGGGRYIDENQQKIEAKQKKQLKNKLKAQGLSIKDLKYEFNKANKIRFMNPLNLICGKCQTYIPKNRKFNGYKREVNQLKEFEDASSREYLKNIKIFELKYKCPFCSSDIVLRTDPLQAAAIGANFSKDEEGKSNNEQKEDGYIIISGASFLKKRDEPTKMNDVDKIIENIEYEEKLAEEKLLNSVDQNRNMAEQLSALKKQQLDDEEIENLRLAELNRQNNIKEIYNAKNDDIKNVIQPALKDIKTIKVVNKKNKGKKKIIKL